MSEENGIITFAIHIAAMEGDIDRMKELIGMGERKYSLFAKLPFGDSPLHIAVMEGNIEVVIFILNELKKMGSSYPINRNEESPLHTAYRTLKWMELDRFPIQKIQKQKEIINILESNGMRKYDVSLFGQTPEMCYNPHHRFPDKFFQPCGRLIRGM